MMRPVLMLGAIAVASAGQTQCALDGAASVDSFANAALNIWAATKRCEEGKAHTAMCAVDIASSIGAVNDMITTMVGAVDGCGALKSSHYACGMSIGGLTSASAKLAASTAGMLANCPTGEKQSPANPPGLSTHLGSCVVDAKMSMTALFDAAHKFSAVKKESNAKNDLNVVSALANLGSFLAGAVAQCSVFEGKGNAAAGCASHSLGLVAALHNVANAGVNIADKCKVTAAERLYLENREATPAGSTMPHVHAALHPNTAVFSFVAGSRFAKSRAQSVREADCEQLMQE